MAEPYVLTLKDGRRVNVQWTKPTPPTPEDVDNLALDAEEAFAKKSVAAATTPPALPRMSDPGYRSIEDFAKERGFTVTSTIGGEHNVGSAHYEGRAVDIRTRDKSEEEIQRIKEEAQAAGYTVLDERQRPKGQKVWSGPHLHLETAGGGNRPEAAPTKPAQIAGAAAGLKPPKEAPEAINATGQTLIDIGQGKRPGQPQAKKPSVPKPKGMQSLTDVVQAINEGKIVGKLKSQFEDLPFTMEKFQWAIDHGLHNVPTKAGGILSIKNASARVAKITGQTSFPHSTPEQAAEAARERGMERIREERSANEVDFAGRLKENLKNVTGVDFDETLPYHAATLDIFAGLLSTPLVTAKAAHDIATDPVGAINNLPDLAASFMESINVFDPSIDGPERYKRLVNGALTLLGVKAGIGSLKRFADTPGFERMIAKLGLKPPQAFQIMDKVIADEGVSVAKFEPEAPKPPAAPEPPAVTSAPGESTVKRTSLKPEQIKVHPKIQYKSGLTDTKANVTSEYKGVKVYDVDQGGDLLVWQDKNGQKYVVNGHHRLDIANRAERFISTRDVAGKIVEVPRELPVRILKETDGWTLEKARAQGALENIRDGKGNALDALRVMKDLNLSAEALAERGMTFKSTLGRNVAGLMKLTDEALEPAFNGKVKEDVAAGIGSAELSPMQQKAAMRHAETLRSFEEGASFANDVKNSEIIQGIKDSQGSMFDDDPVVQEAFSTAVEKTKIKSAVSAAIGRERGDLLKIPAELLEDESLNVEARQKLASQYGESAKGAKGAAAYVLDVDKDLNARLSDWAKRIGNGEATVEQATADLIAGTREALKGGLKKYIGELRNAPQPERAQGATPVGEGPDTKAAGDQAPSVVTVEGYRGSPTDPTAAGIGGGRFFTPDEATAKSYANGGTVVKETLTFEKPLIAENWGEAKRQLGMPQDATMAELVVKARKQGHDGIIFKSHNGKPEYVDLADQAPVGTGRPVETPEGTDWGSLGQQMIDEAQARIAGRKPKGGKAPGGKKSGATNVGPEDFKRAFQDAADEVVTAAGYVMKHGGHLASAVTHMANDLKLSPKKVRAFVTEAEQRLKTAGYESPVKKASALLATAGPANKEQIAINKEIRAKQAAMLQDVRGKGEAGLKEGLNILKGKFPKVSINPIGEKLSSLERDQLLNIIDARDDLSPQAQVGLKQDLIKLFDFGEVPTKYSLDWFRKIYGQDFVSSILKNRDLWGKTKSFLGDLIVGLSRVMTATADNSFGLNQGIKAFFTDNPTWRDAFVKSWQAMANEDVANLINHQVKVDPDVKIGMQHGLDILEAGAGDIALAEELFVGGPFIQWIEDNVPPIKGANRAYVTWGNVLRGAKWKQGLELLERNGHAGDDAQLDFWAGLTNKWAGRGSLGKGFASRAGNFLAGIFYSPKFNLALWQHPITSVRGLIEAPPEIRKQIAKDMAKWLIGTAAVLEAGQKREFEYKGEKRQWGIWDVSYDPEDSAHFLKATIGDRHYDLTGGYGPLLSTMWILSPFTNERTTLAGNKKEFTPEGPFAETKYDYALRFLRKKFSPVAGLTSDVLAQETVTGEPVTAGGEAWDRLVPFWIQDMKDAIDSEMAAQGRTAPALAKGAGEGVLSFFGLRVNTFSPPSRRSTRRPNRGRR